MTEIKSMWKSLMEPVYQWTRLGPEDEKWADWTVMFLTALILIDLVVM